MPPEGVLERSAASLPRVLWGEFPALRGTISRLRRLSRLHAVLRCLRLALPCLWSRSLPSAGPPPTCLGSARTALHDKEQRSPGSWATLAYIPMLFDPGGVTTPGHPVPPLLPSAIPTTSAPPCHFRGSIAQPARPLFTLRRRDHSRTTPHSVPVDGQPLPVRDLHPAGHTKRFRIVSSCAIVPLFQALPGATELRSRPFFGSGYAGLGS